ncbi:MAG: hypothetical protein HKN91_14595 [Acidimicrobiia bacterium]|nr:hypothetical protein [Acidimicrobiia bacterium]
MTFTDDADRFNRALRELDEVQQLLTESEPTDFARRQDLRDRESALRAEIRGFGQEWTDHLSIDQLRRRIEEVESQIEDHYGNRLSHTSGGQSGLGGGLDPKYLHAMHRAMDKSGDIEHKKAELRRLKDQLTRLEGS